MRRIQQFDLQQLLIQALHPLRATHPKINENLPIIYLKNHAILRSQLGINYLKAFWIVWMLVMLDPSIMKDKKSADLRNFACFCASHIKIIQ
jgi:hypothetical protein